MRKETLIDTPVFWLDRHEGKDGEYRYLVDSMWMNREQMERNLKSAVKIMKEIMKEVEE